MQVERQGALQLFSVLSVDTSEIRELSPACSAPTVASLRSCSLPYIDPRSCTKTLYSLRRHNGERGVVEAGGAATAAGGGGAPRVRRPPWSAAGGRHNGPPPGGALLRRPVLSAGAGDHCDCPKPDWSRSRSPYGIVRRLPSSSGRQRRRRQRHAWTHAVLSTVNLRHVVHTCTTGWGRRRPGRAAAGGAAAGADGGGECDELREAGGAGCWKHPGGARRRCPGAAGGPPAALGPHQVSCLQGHLQPSATSHVQGCQRGR